MVTSSSIILAFTHTLDVLILVLTERCHQKPRTFQRKKATREEDRTTVKRIVCTDNEQLDAPISDELDQSKQAQHVLTLRFKLETLKVLDKDILSNLFRHLGFVLLCSTFYCGIYPIHYKLATKIGDLLIKHRRRSSRRLFNHF